MKKVMISSLTVFQEKASKSFLILPVLLILSFCDVSAQESVYDFTFPALFICKDNNVTAVQKKGNLYFNEESCYMLKITVGNTDTRVSLYRIDYKKNYFVEKFKTNNLIITENEVGESITFMKIDLSTETNNSTAIFNLLVTNNDDFSYRVDCSIIDNDDNETIYLFDLDEEVFSSSATKIKSGNGYMTKKEFHAKLGELITAIKKVQKE